MATTLKEVQRSGIDEITGFTAQARQKGLGYETIWRLLSSGGWKDKDIARVIAAEGLGISIPTAVQKGAAREAFFHLSAFACLYVAAISLLSMISGLIDIAFPDPVNMYWDSEWSYSSIRYSLSIVLIFAPLYVVFSWIIARQTARGELRIGGSVERWLTYLTLFAIVMAMLADTAVVVFGLLEGELNERVLLKSASVMVVLGGAFYYLWMGTKRWSA